MSLEKKPSTAFSQKQEAGVKWKVSELGSDLTWANACSQRKYVANFTLGNLTMKLLHKGAVAALVLSLYSGSAKASLVIDFNQVGSNVIASGNGTLNLSGLTPAGNYLLNVEVDGLDAYYGTGVPNSLVQGYNGISGPSQFGSQSILESVTSTGDTFAFGGQQGQLFLKSSFVSGLSLTFTSTFANATFASLGLTEGTYKYTLPDDTFTVNIGGVISAVPLPASAPMFGAALLGLAGLGYAANRKKAAAAA